MDNRRAGYAVLVAGLLLLAASVVLALTRGSDEGSAKAEVARYDAASKRAVAPDPRFDVSVVQFDLKDLDQLQREEPVVMTPVARRLRSGRRHLSPDFAGLAPPAGFETFPRDYASGHYRKLGVSVFAVRVGELPPGPPVRVRLAVREIELTGFASLLEGRDLTPGRDGHAAVEDGAPVTRVHKRVVTWRPDKRTGLAIVPLAVTHRFVLRQPYYDEAVSRGESISAYVTDRVVLIPQRLSASRPGEPAEQIDIRGALENPLVLQPRAG